MNLFLTAAKEKYRFPSNKGDLTVEQLFDLPLLDSRSAFDLNSVAMGLNRSLQAIEQESFVEVKNQPLKSSLANRLEIVKEIISIKKAEKDAAIDAKARADRRQQLLEALEKRQQSKLMEMGEDELLKELQSL